MLLRAYVIWLKNVFFKLNKISFLAKIFISKKIFYKNVFGDKFK